MHYIIISSPSGGGKTTMCNMLINAEESPVASRVKFSISATTRARRPHETNGKEYFFISKEQFKDMVENGEFLEYAEICGNFYGTPKKKISNDHHTLFDIDFQGFIQINENFGTNLAENKQELLTIFLLPPSLEVLQDRLERRGDIVNDIILQRMKNAVLDISYSKQYGYVMVNNNIDETFRKICAIVDFAIHKKQSDLHQKLWNVSEEIKGIKSDNPLDYLKEALNIVI